mgnify:CR=1 FL=1
MLIHLIDGTGEDIVGEYRTIRKELKAYDPQLAEKPELLVLNKADALDADERKAKVAALKKAAKVKPHLISAVSGEGVIPLLREAARLVREHRADEKAAAAGPATESWRP